MNKREKRTKEIRAWDRKIGAAMTFLRRRDSGRNQSFCATLLNISRGHLANVETGRTPLSAILGWKFCDVFNVHPSWLTTAGKGDAGIFPRHIEPETLAQIEKIIAANGSAPFREIWPPLAWLTRIDDEKNMQPTLDKPLNFGDAADVPKITTLPELIAALKKLTKVRGLKAELADHCHVTRQAVDQWLRNNDAVKPSADAVFAAIEWVQKRSKATK